MKQVVSAALVAAMAWGGSAHAAISEFILDADGPPVQVLGYTLDGFQGQYALNYSDLWSGFAGLVVIQTSAIAPATFHVPDYDVTHEFESFHAPLQRVAGRLDSSSGLASISRLDVAGGFTLVTHALLPNGKKNSASKGGSFSLTNLTVDFDTRGIYADVVGGNAAGEKKHQLMWSFTDIEGSTGLNLPDCPLTPTSTCTPNLTPKGAVLKGMTLTQEGHDFMSASLGFTAFGEAAFAGVADWGTVTISAIPEPSSLALIFAGLAAVGPVASRRQRRHRG